jgi:hypothetical protein
LAEEAPLLRSKIPLKTPAEEEIDIGYNIYNADYSENVLLTATRLGVYLPCITS